MDHLKFDVQTHVLNKLVKIPINGSLTSSSTLYQYRMEKVPDKFEPWLTQLENACIVGKRDVREVAICSCAGPVLEVISSIDLTEPWSVH